VIQALAKIRITRKGVPETGRTKLYRTATPIRENGFVSLGITDISFNEYLAVGMPQVPILRLQAQQLPEVPGHAYCP
jgi:hypothetical protein